MVKKMYTLLYVRHAEESGIAVIHVLPMVSKNVN